jgi:hypothetical protein
MSESEQLGDVIHIETADGNELFFTGSDFKLLAYGNLGAPPTNYITRKGYKQNGVTEVDFLLNPRSITVDLWSSPTADRQTYWDNRKELHDFLRPNRNGPLTFTLRTTNGNLRSIIVRADPGMMFPPQPSNNDWALQESFDFICFDPTFFNSAQVDLIFTTASQLQLVFPITFPISFGTSDELLSSGIINYAGTWKSYPVITLIGPYSRAVIANVTTGKAIFMSVPILAGEERIIDLTPGAQSITDANGVNKFSDLGVGSNLIEFALLPDPEVPDGQQEITIQLVGGVNGVSGASLTYYERYFAL